MKKYIIYIYKWGVGGIKVSDFVFLINYVGFDTSRVFSIFQMLCYTLRQKT